MRAAIYVRVSTADQITDLQIRDLQEFVARQGWERTKAVRTGRVYCINDEFLNTPASTLINGLRALAAAIHPEEFAAEVGLRRIVSEISSAARDPYSNEG